MNKSTSTVADPIAVRLDTAAQMLDASPAMVANWVRSGKIPAVKVGRAWRIRTDDLRRLLDTPVSVEP